MINFQEEKGLFTFYREQAEQQQQMKQEKMLQKKRKLQPAIIQQRNNKKKVLQSVHSDILSQKIKKQWTQQLPKVKQKSKKAFRNVNNDCSVIIVDSGDHYSHNKPTKRQLEKKPLSMLMFDPKFQQANKNGFSIPRTELGNKNVHGNRSKQKSKINLQEFKLNQIDIFNEKRFLHNSKQKTLSVDIPASIRNRGIFGKYHTQHKHTTKQYQSVRASLQAKQCTQSVRQLPQIPERKKGVNQSFDSARVNQKVSRLPDNHNFYVYDKIRKIEHPQQYHIHKKYRSYIGGVIDINDQKNRNQIIASKGQGLSINQNSKLLELLRKIKLAEK